LRLRSRPFADWRAPVKLVVQAAAHDLVIRAMESRPIIALIRHRITATESLFSATFN
jgi:hypothetical protein